MESGIYRVCCCFSRHCPAHTSYIELDDSAIKVKSSNDRLNEGADNVGDYRTLEDTPLVAVSIHGEQEEEGFTGYQEGQRGAAAVSGYNIQSEVLLQRSSWQSASFALAQASQLGRARNGISEFEGGSNSRSRKFSGVSRRTNSKINSRNKLGDHQNTIEKSDEFVSENKEVRFEETKMQLMPRTDNELSQKESDKMVLSNLGESTQADSDTNENNELPVSVMQPFLSLFGALKRSEKNSSESKASHKECPSENEESTTSSIATSDISTDPSSDEEDTNKIILKKMRPSLKRKQSIPNRTEPIKKSEKAGVKEIKKYEEESSSIATEELSDTSNEEHSPPHRRINKVKSYDNGAGFSGKMNLKNIEKAGIKDADLFVKNAKLEESLDAKELNRTYMDLGLDDLNSPEDPKQFDLDSDSDLSFSGRTSDDNPEEKTQEKPFKFSHHKNMIELRTVKSVKTQGTRKSGQVSPALSSCVEESTVVGSCVTGISSGGDTITPEMSVSRAGIRESVGEGLGGKQSEFFNDISSPREPEIVRKDAEANEFVEKPAGTVKKKHGIVSKFKKKVWKK